MLVHQKDGKFFKSHVYKDGDYAVKSVYPKTESAMGRLSKELQILSSLNSPYFVIPVSAKKTGGCYRITTEWVKTQPITDPLIFLQGLDELEKALLASKIRHRDIRQPNIIPHGNKPVLIDFGWAIHADETDEFDSVLPYANDHQSIETIKNGVKQLC